MKRPSLAASIKAAAAPAAPAMAEEPFPPAAAPPSLARMPPPSNDGQAEPKGKRGSSREGRKAVYAWMDPAEHLQLKRLSLDTGRTIDALVAEAVQDLMIKHGAKN